MPTVTCVGPRACSHTGIHSVQRLNGSRIFFPSPSRFLEWCVIHPHLRRNSKQISAELNIRFLKLQMEPRCPLAVFHPSTVALGVKSRSGFSKLNYHSESFGTSNACIRLRAPACLPPRASPTGGRMWMKLQPQVSPQGRMLLRERQTKRICVFGRTNPDTLLLSKHTAAHCRVGR